MAKKMSRHYPVQRNIRLADLTAAVAGGRFVSCNKLLSFTNRRLYRQSRVYSAKVDVDVGSALATAGVDVYVLRDTWDLHGAYKLAMAHYYNAMKEEIEGAKGAQTRWHDFRVLSDYQVDELVPVTQRPASSGSGFNNDRLTTGDFDPSFVVDSAGTSHGFTLGVGGGPTNDFGIIDEWRRLDRVHSDPASASTTLPYDGLVEDLDEANYDILRDNGAVPPYNDETDLFLWTKVATIKETGGGSQKLSSGFFDAPLGFILLKSAGFAGDGTIVEEHPVSITLQTGDYKGVKAPAYATPRLTPEKKYEVV